MSRDSRGARDRRRGRSSRIKRLRFFALIQLCQEINVSDDLGLEADLERGCFRDARGRRVLLRGANVGGRAKRAPFLPLELDEPHSQTF